MNPLSQTITDKAQVSPAANARPFFSLNAKYVIDPASERGDLVTDASCLVSTAISSVRSVVNSFGDHSYVEFLDFTDLCSHLNELSNILYGALYQLEMAENLVEALEVRS